MEIDIKTLISIRSKATSQISEKEEPVDMLFIISNDNFNMAPVPFQGDFPPSYKYNARKQALRAFIAGTASPQLKYATRLVYCSLDPIYDVDYCFDIDNLTKEITLYIVKNGNIARRYKNYDVDYDERPDLAQL